MSSLLAKQILFARLLGRLIGFAYSQGYALTLGDGYRPDGNGHMKGSLHYVRLAQDLNLFIDGQWIKDGSHPAWLTLATFWKGLDPLCAAGYDFGDANHFSLMHEGKK